VEEFAHWHGKMNLHKSIYHSLKKNKKALKALNKVKPIRLLLAVLISIFIINTLQADPVDSLSAKTIAVNFYTRFVNNKTKSGAHFNLTHTETFNIPNHTKGNEGTPLYYVFNKTTGNGFVIVSADNDMKPVLGYSDENTYSDTNQPPALSAWMKEYKGQMIQVKQNSVKGDAETKQQWMLLAKGEPASKGTTTAFHLLTTTWNQGNTSRNGYYNNLCPYDHTLPDNINISVHCPTGCVATAMAQIMKYWNYPIKGSGSTYYSTNNYGQLSANFYTTSYDWPNMSNTYGLSNTTAQIMAVSTLMYHCGVSTHTDFEPDASSAEVFTYSDAPYSAQNAYKTYFGYDAKLQAMYKTSNVTDASWKTTLKNELDNGRPFQYTDYDENNDGHSWVCDGYDESDYFHMNWGWGGACNGFYDLSALNTDNGNFSATKQSALIGIQPDCVDLLHTGIWTGTKDNRSSINAALSTSAAIITCPYSVAKTSSPQANDTYVALNGQLIYGGDMSGLANIILTYQSDQPLILSLPQPKLKDAGESYQVSLKATGANFVSINIPVSAFTQPDGSLDTNIPLQLDSVFSIEITPDVVASSSAVNGTVVIKELLLYNVKNKTYNDTKATNNNVTIYPNPTPGHLMFRTSASVTLNYLKIYDMLGNLVYSNNINNSSTIDISGFSHGLYIVRLQADNGTVVKKIMKE